MLSCERKMINNSNLTGMQNYSLKSKSEYQSLLNKLEQAEIKLLGLKKRTNNYNKSLKNLIKLTLSAKTSGYCLDNKRERKKATNFIYNLLIEIEII